jgi:hypothetical protein
MQAQNGPVPEDLCYGEIKGFEDSTPVARRRADAAVAQKQQARFGRIDGATFCCNFHRGVVRGELKRVQASRTLLRGSDCAVVVAERRGDQLVT